MRRAKLLKYLAVLIVIFLASCECPPTLLDSPPPTLDPADVSDHFPV